MDNWQRAERAAEQVEHLADHNDLETQIKDLLCNLRHLCDREGFDFEELDIAGENHYEAEIAEEGKLQV